MGGFNEGNGKTNLCMHFDKEKHLCAWSLCERNYKGMLVDEDGTYSYSTNLRFSTKISKEFPLLGCIYRCRGRFTFAVSLVVQWELQ